MAKPRAFMAVLAAGASRRFGDYDKISANFRGKRLGEWVTANAPTRLIEDGCAVVVASRVDHPCRAAWERAGFQIALNARADQGMGTSVALAAALAIKARCDALLIALADMPLVPEAHYEALINACRSQAECVCSSDGQRRSPPVIFGAKHFSALSQLDEDVGARTLLKSAKTLPCPPEWLEDIDTPEALARLTQR